MNVWMAGINQMAAVGLAALLNTLWYAAAVVGLTWAALRYSQRVNAATRYWIWVAVLGFLVLLPFLPALTSQLETAGEPAAVAPLATVPATPQFVQHIAPVTITLDSTPGPNRWPLYLLTIWIVIAGWQLALLLEGVISVKRMKAHAKAGPAVGLPVQPLRKLEVLASDEINSPVAVGYIHPAVILPTGLPASLEEGEMQDVLLHELAHLTRYDDWLNLATRALGALLVLHPLAAIVLRQIAREREMACDDFVVAHTGSAQSYARSLARLHDLHSKTGTRLLASALLGRKVSLPDRIESLLRHGRQFSTQPSLANIGLSTFLLVVLLGASGLIPAWIAIAQAKAPPPSFEVASIKPNPGCENKPTKSLHVFSPSPDLLEMPCVNLKSLIQTAYGTFVDGVSINPQPLHMEGELPWMSKVYYSLSAKAFGPESTEMLAGPMLQMLLQDHFRLKTHRVMQEMQVYGMTAGTRGLKVRPLAKDACTPIDLRHPPAPTRPGGPLPNVCGIMTIRPTESGEMMIDVRGSTMGQFAQRLSQFADGTVVDNTNVVGRFNFHLEFAPARGMPGQDLPSGHAGDVGNAANVNTPLPPPAPGPSLFVALREQIGLKLSSEKGLISVLVIDHVEKPAEN